MTAARSGAAPLTLARWAGALYLLIIVFGIWSEVAVRAALVVPGDATATAANILAAPMLFRLSFAADVVMALSDVALAVLLYALLRPAGPVLALMATAFRLLQTAIIGANLMNHHAATLILGGEAGLAAFAPAQRDELALFHLTAQSHGYDLGLVFFGLGNLILAVLVVRSGFLPKALGYLLGAAGLVYLAGSALRFLAPALTGAFQAAYVVPLVAEAGFCLWLLVRGVDAARWHALAD